MDFNKLWSDVDLKSQKQNTRCLAVNTILAGKYLVGPVLGQGGFGITYLGYDLNMETRIAIKEYFPVELVSRDTTTMHGDKVLSLSGEKSQTYQQGLKKYVAEAQNVSQFADVPGVVSVKVFFYENETAYIVMEYIDGISLKDYLKEKGGRLSEEETLAIMKSVLEALEKIHNAGIIHRDISPDNIMLTFEEPAGAPGSRTIKSVKLIDFGAARMTAKNDQKSLTIILKHGYAPEEQYRTHGEQGSWTDVYAVCAVMYRMLTGQTPVPAMDRMFKDELKNFEELGFALKEGMTQSAAAGTCRVSTGTAAAIMKGLAVKKEDRIQSMRDLIAVLYEGAKVTGGKSAAKQKHLWIGIGAAAAVLVVILAVIAVFGMKYVSDRNQNTPDLQASADWAETAGGVDETAAVEFTADSQGSLPEASEEVLVDMDGQEDDFGEVIITATNHTSIAGCDSHIIYIHDDGTVSCIGSNQYGQGNVGDWERIAAVTVGNTFSAGLREDGKVLIAGELKNKEDVENWSNIVAIACDWEKLYGLTAEGTVVCNQTGITNEKYLEWTNIKAISAGVHVVAALTEDGQVLVAGFLESEELKAQEITGWEDVQFIANNQKCVYGVRSDGSVVYAQPWKETGNEEYSTYDLKERVIRNLDSCRDIVQICVDVSNYFAVSSDGTFYSNVYDKYDYISDWGSLKEIAVYGNRTVGIQEDGTMKYYAENSGNAELSEMNNLVSVAVDNGVDQNTLSVVGITRDHKLKYYSLDNGMRNPEMGFKGDTMPDSIADMVIHNSTVEADDGGTVSAEECAILTGDGILYMCVEHSNDYTAVADNIQQITAMEGGHYDGYVAALTKDKTVKLISTAYDWEPSESMMEAENWTDVEQIAGYQYRDSVGCGIVGLKSDGTVLLAQTGDVTTTDVSTWTDIQSIHGGVYGVGAVRKDGTAVFLEEAAEHNYGQYNTESWRDLTQLALGTYHTAGLKADGTVYAIGRNDAGQCEVEDWTDIVYIAAGDSCTVGIKSDGSLVFAGNMY